MKPVKVGVIGCGVIGSRHLGIASEASHIELVAAADMIEENRTTAAKRFNLSLIHISEPTRPY